MPRTPGYATRQRSLVLECLKAHAGQYLSVADIAADLTKKGSPVGVTTIYRALEKLASEGTVRRFVPDRTSPAVSGKPGAGRISRALQGLRETFSPALQRNCPDG